MLQCKVATTVLEILHIELVIFALHCAECCTFIHGFINYAVKRQNFGEGLKCYFIQCSESEGGVGGVERKFCHVSV